MDLKRDVNDLAGGFSCMGDPLLGSGGCLTPRRKDAKKSPLRLGGFAAWREAESMGEGTRQINEP